MENFSDFQNLLEGNLTDSQEKDLYSILSTDSNTRIEFKNMLTFQKALDNSKILSVIPAESEKALFGALGFGEATSVAVSSSMVSPTGIIMKYFGIASIGAVISALVFFGFPEKFGYIKNNMASEHVIAHKIDNKNISFENRNNNRINNIDTIKKSFVSKNKLPKTSSIENKIRFVGDNKIKNSILTNSQPYVQNLLSTPVLSNNRIISTLSNPYSNNLNFINKNDLSLCDNSYGIITEVQSMQSWFDSQTKAVPDKIAPFHNMMISVYYEPLKNIYIGLNLRNETFYEDFTGKDEIGQLTWVEQQPNFTTYSLVLKYNSQFEIFSQLKPNFTIAYGFNSAGNVARLGAGVRYDYNDAISFLLGFEYSGMFFKYQNSNFLTNKYAINYGISLKI